MITPMDILFGVLVALIFAVTFMRDGKGGGR
jgi:hypothetical protein